MITKKITIDPENIDEQKLREAADALAAGKTVVFPTETVYGLGANALDEDAVEKIFEAKGRPSDNPLIVHVANKNELTLLVEEVPPIAETLIESFWPGPLTLVMKRSKNVPDQVAAGLDTVAVRMPSNPIARRLIDYSGVPVAAPSANLSGKPSPTEPKHVIEDLDGRVDVIISGGSCEVGLESTVLDVTETVPVILRPGGITKESIEAVIGNVVVDPAILGYMATDEKPRSPGVKYTHYAPKAAVTIITGEIDHVVSLISKIADEKTDAGISVGIMATDETFERYEKGQVISMGSRYSPETIASRIFAVLRQFDEDRVEMILVEGIEEQEIGLAIMDRLIKAAGYQVIKVGGRV